MDECLGVGGEFEGAGERGGQKSEYPCSWLKCTIRGSSEIELLCLHVGSRVEAERSSLSGFGDQVGIFVNLEGVDETRDVRRETGAERGGHMRGKAGRELTSSPEKY